jgi:methionyl-tRNA formyltransferase
MRSSDMRQQKSERLMRVLLITQGRSRIVEPLWRSRHSVIAVAEAAPRSYRGTVRSKMRKLLRAAVGASNRRLGTLRQYCRHQRTPYFWLARDNMAEFVHWVRAKAPDVIVIFSMSQLLPKEVFQLPTHGAINLHPSYLPEYRGPNPEFWQYYFKELSPGITVHYVNAYEDFGDIIHQTRVSVPLGIKSPQLLDKLVSEAGVSILLKALDELEAGVAPRRVQPESSPTIRARNLIPEEHRSLIDWETWPIERIWHLLRGTETWLNCISPPFGIYSGQRWEVLNYEDGGNADRALGTVQFDERGYFVSCRDGVIRLKVHFSIAYLLRRLASLI